MVPLGQHGVRRFWPQAHPGIAGYRGQAASFFGDEKTIVSELGTPDARRDNKRQKKYLPLEIDLSSHLVCVYKSAFESLGGLKFND